MSYSFSVRGASRAEVVTKIAAELDKVVASQPMHSNDRDRALATAQSFLELLPEKPEGREIQVSVHGSVGWTPGSDSAANVITGAGVGVSASLA